MESFMSEEIGMAWSPLLWGGVISFGAEQEAEGSGTKCQQVHPPPPQSPSGLLCRLPLFVGGWVLFPYRTRPPLFPQLSAPCFEP